MARNSKRWPELFNHLRNYVIEEVHRKKVYPNLTSARLQDCTAYYTTQEKFKDFAVYAVWLVTKHKDEPVNWYKELLILSKTERAENASLESQYHVLAARIDASLRIMNEGGIGGEDEGELPHAEDSGSTGEAGSPVP